MIIGIEKCDDTKILINTGEELADEFTLKNAVIKISCVIIGDNEFYLQLF